MDSMTYFRLRGFARDALGEQLDTAERVPFGDMARATELLVSGMGAAATSAAAMLRMLDMLRYFTEHDGATPEETASFARQAHEHAQGLAAHLPPGPAAELLRLTAKLLPQETAAAPAPAASKPQAAAEPEPAGKRWTPETLAELSAYREANGTKAAAAWAGVSPARVRELLPSDKPQPKPFPGFPGRST